MARDLIRYNLRRADALAVKTTTDDSVNPAGLNSVFSPVAVAKADTAKYHSLQGSNGGKEEISHTYQIPSLAISGKRMRIVNRWLAIGLTAAALVQAPLSYADTVLLTQLLKTRGGGFT